MITVGITGRGVADAARRLQLAADGRLRDQVGKAVEAAARPVPAAVARRAMQVLPRSGGFAALVAASQFTITPIRGASTVGVRIVVINPMDEARIDQGRLRHPRFGDRAHWYTQKVPAGTFSLPVRDAAEDMRTGINAAVRQTLGGT